MKTKVFIVEDQFAEAHNLQIMLEKAGYEVCGVERTAEGALAAIERLAPQLVLVDIFLKGPATGIDLAKKLHEKNIAFVYISANFDNEILSTAKETQPYGFLIKPFRERDMLVTLEIANYRHTFNVESRQKKVSLIENQFVELLGGDGGDSDEYLLEVCQILQQHIPFDLMLVNTFSNAYAGIQTGYQRIGYQEYRKVDPERYAGIVGSSASGFTALSNSVPFFKQATIYNEEQFEVHAAQSGLVQQITETLQVCSCLYIPINYYKGHLVQLCLYHQKPNAYGVDHLALVYHLNNVLREIAQKVVTDDQSPVRSDKTYTPVKKRNNHAAVFPDMIGSSQALLNVFDAILQVAPFDTSVLILGESGTGKERVADYIHALSSRKGKPFIKVNCAVMPPSLIESELFGHEKGAFTGAAESHQGYFEQAQNGTVFLDEIGEMPVDLQAKLLRALQEKEIRRVGGRTPLKVNVRIVAATNQNLEDLVTQKKFRLDLYYRLNVFPIELPALRNRREDIVPLAEHFVNKFSAAMAVGVKKITAPVLQKLQEYDWPGNVRQLENLIERSVLQAKGSEIKEIPLPRDKDLNDAGPRSARPAETHQTWAGNEREYILSVLRQCKGRIWGPSGAAAVMNVPPTTLNSRIKKLGIRREFTT
ncbi:sigma 54-interacting response regulator [Parachryseolinea silvisoli]|uniref:sigma 54-interacting response regulator n=1 Tax=Parachryseolinea silvisoli TaxID=2873601 RepID=UPI002265E61A|nr:sigma 54-interacting response regulator [Parachryseolinea silvisoli]MCD9017688.1 sigma 54-interacting transcriptional regulator [Parachryseolinea silvisoli]